jgi:group I intron endonuclease
MTCGSIYKIEFPNGKHYIGLTTTSLEQRRKEHKRCAKNGDSRCLYNALRKYDMVDTFELVEIDTSDTLEELCEKEIGYIIEYNSYYINENGYNMTSGGDGTTGYVFTEEDKEQISESLKKYFEENPEAGKEHGEKMKKRFENPEARQKQSESLKKYFEENPEAGKEHGEKMKKRFETPEARQKIGEAVKQNLEENPELRKKISESQKKRFENPEERQQMREIKKKYFQDNPEARKKLLDGKGKNKPFDVFKKEGTFIGTFNYQFEAKEYLQKEHNISSSILISQVLSGKRASTAGFIFKYK